MTSQFVLEGAELKVSFSPNTPVRRIFEALRKELASEHKVLTKCFIDDIPFDHELGISIDQSVSDVHRIGYEVVTVVKVVEEMVDEWDTILTRLRTRMTKIAMSQRLLEVKWMNRETDDILETVTDVSDSYESLKCYFGDPLLAPFIQIDQLHLKMHTFSQSLKHSLIQNDQKRWKSLLNSEFVEILELWQTFFYGIRRIFF